MQLKLGNILKLVSELIKAGTPMKEIEELPVYIGDDDELNGIHTAWFCQKIDGENKDDNYFIEMIGEGQNVEFTGKAILIS